jgi:glycerophosphoryl diester phosphodiesterase
MRVRTPHAPDWLTARPIAHRGLHDIAQGRVENSLGALRAAMQAGYAAECDLRLSRDGKVFVFHDDALDRLTQETGLFGRRDAAELETIFLRGSRDRIPSLADWLAAAQGAAPLILELKSDFSGDTALAAAVAAALEFYAGPVALKSFDPALIASLRAARAPWPLGMVAQAAYTDDFRLSATQCDTLRSFTHTAETRPDFLSFRAADLPQPICELARACAGIPVMAWTIRSPEQAATACRHADQIVFEGFAPDAQKG